MSSTCRAYLELARISNVPTVLSNAMAGAACAAFRDPLAIQLAPVVAASAACAAFYVAGMALNDVFDREIDRVERPQRPIPSGRVTTRGAVLFAATLIVSGLALLALVNLLALVAGCALVVCILFYDLIHATAKWSVLIMGTCRGLVYVVGALAIGVPESPIYVLVPAMVLLLYVASFSVIARREAITFASAPRFQCGSCGYPSMRDRGRCSECGHEFSAQQPDSIVFVDAVPVRHMRVVILLSILLLCPVAIFGLVDLNPRVSDSLNIALGVGALCSCALILACTNSAARLVTQKPPKIGPAVMLWIATISIYDAYVMFLARSLPLAMIAFVCFALTRWAQRRIAGT